MRCLCICKYNKYQNKVSMLDHPMKTPGISLHSVNCRTNIVDNTLEQLRYWKCFANKLYVYFSPTKEWIYNLFNEAQRYSLIQRSHQFVYFSIVALNAVYHINKTMVGELIKGNSLKSQLGLPINNNINLSNAVLNKTDVSFCLEIKSEETRCSSMGRFFHNVGLPWKDPLSCAH